MQIDVASLVTSLLAMSVSGVIAYYIRAVNASIKEVHVDMRTHIRDDAAAFASMGEKIEKHHDEIHARISKVDTRLARMEGRRYSD